MLSDIWTPSASSLSFFLLFPLSLSLSLADPLFLTYKEKLNNFFIFNFIFIWLLLEAHFTLNVLEAVINPVSQMPLLESTPHSLLSLCVYQWSDSFKLLCSLLCNGTHPTQSEQDLYNQLWCSFKSSICTHSGAATKRSSFFCQREQHPVPILLTELPLWQTHSLSLIPLAPSPKDKRIRNITSDYFCTKATYSVSHLY